MIIYKSFFSKVKLNTESPSHWAGRKLHLSLLEFPLCSYFWASSSKHFILLMKSSHCSILFHMGYYWDAHGPSPYDCFEVKMILWLSISPENENIFKSLYAFSYILEHLKRIRCRSYILKNLCTSNPSWDLEKTLSLSLFLSISFQSPSPYTASLLEYQALFLQLGYL